MRRNLCVLALLALMTAAILPSVAHAETVVSHFKGITAYATFWSLDPTGCISTYTDVSVYESIYRNPPENSGGYAVVYLGIYRYDYCQNLYLNEAYGYANLAEGAFDTRGKLQTARLVTTLEAYDWVTDTTAPVSVDLTWTGTGDVSRGGYNSRGNYANYRYMSHSVGSNRPASLAGSVVFGDINLTPDSSSWASLSESQSGSVTTSHQPH
jgi:hypothetical protein